MKSALEAIRARALERLQNAEDLTALEEARVQLLGKKGELTAILKTMGQLSPEERPVMGQMANEVRAAIEEKLAARGAALKAAMAEQKLKMETIDVTLPGKPVREGHRHPLNLVLDEIKEIFLGMGFSMSPKAPRWKLDYYNFEALNHAATNHPARDTQDTFYITDKVAAAHPDLPHADPHHGAAASPPSASSPPAVCTAAMQWMPPTPLCSIRSRAWSWTRASPWATSRAALEMVVKRLYGEEARRALPSAPLPLHRALRRDGCDQCFKCHGTGLPASAKGEGWIEILGCGMVHPKVLARSAVLDPEEVHRLRLRHRPGAHRHAAAMLIDDLRLFYEDDTAVPARSSKANQERG